LQEPPLFVTFEGPEGGGKTTQIRLLAGWLQEQGWDVVTTREPGGTRIGDGVRGLLLNPEHVEMQPEAEILLFSAARAQLVGEIIRPHLARGGIVLCDRFADSTLAYQGYGRGLDLNALRMITAFATGNLVPDLTICLDLPVREGLQRKRFTAQAETGHGAAGDDWNRMEREELEFHERVRAGYLELARLNGERWLVVDARLSVEQAQEAIRTRVQRILPECTGDGNPVASTAKGGAYQ
jgi:dTMP kinase